MKLLKNYENSQFANSQCDRLLQSDEAYTEYGSYWIMFIINCYRGGGSNGKSKKVSLYNIQMYPLNPSYFSSNNSTERSDEYTHQAIGLYLMIVCNIFVIVGIVDKS